MSATATLGCSVLPRIHKEGDDGFFAKRLGGLQPVQTLNKYEARAVRPDRFAERSDSSCTAGTVHTWPITSICLGMAIGRFRSITDIAGR